MPIDYICANCGSPLTTIKGELSCTNPNCPNNKYVEEREI